MLNTLERYPPFREREFTSPFYKRKYKTPVLVHTGRLTQQKENQKWCFSVQLKYSGFLVFIPLINKAISMKEIPGKTFLFSIFKGHTAIIACKNEKCYRNIPTTRPKNICTHFYMHPNTASFSHMNIKKIK